MHNKAYALKLVQEKINGIYDKYKQFIPMYKNTFYPTSMGKYFR